MFFQIARETILLPITPQNIWKQMSCQVYFQRLLDKVSHERYATTEISLEKSSL